MSYYVGIDPSSVRVGLAALHEHGDLDDTRTLLGRETYQTLHAGTGGDAGRRFVWIRREVQRWLAPFADLGVMCVVIEDPAMHLAGSTVRASLGVVHEAACAMLPDTAVHVLKSTQVKRLALGNGAAKKAQLMEGARLLGYHGADQDTADAICCADAARVLGRKALRKDAA